METKILAVAFIDLEDYTGRSYKIPREKLLKLLDTYDNLIESIFPEFGGKIVKKIGDSFMVVFESPTNAVLCGIEVQNTIFKHNKEVDGSDMLRVKIAIDLGEVHIRKGDVFGDVVNIASRLEKIAQIDDIYFTDAVYFAMNKAEIPSIFVGQKKFKGIPRIIRIFKVLGEYSHLLKKRKECARTKKKIFFWFLTICILSLFIFWGLYLNIFSLDFIKNIFNFFR
ncbi:MAG TPA: adenylate/guanylate cyclase domain-containing protein [Candidatus Nanoarchaeia archaeon]|nr:adenylate/guanylate cyclase domain-containing protein [Candidatus Nanoarchaeia archaeon]